MFRLTTQNSGKHVLTTDLLNVLSLQLDIDCPAGPSDMADPAPTATPHPVPKERTLLPKLGAGLRLASSTRLRAPPASAKGAFIVKIDALARKGGALRLVSVFVRVASGVGAEEVDGWIARAMATAYPGEPWGGGGLEWTRLMRCTGHRQLPSRPARSSSSSTPSGGRARHGISLIPPCSRFCVQQGARWTSSVGWRGEGLAVGGLVLPPATETSHSKHAEEIARETKLDYE